MKYLLCLLLIPFFLQLALFSATAVDSTTAHDFDASVQTQHQRNIDHRERQSLIKFFDHYHCPAINYQLISDYLEAARLYNIDYRLLPAISVQESSCARHYPSNTNNLWGWASARTGFTDFQSGISYITGQLAEGHYYANETTFNKIRAYNPNPGYAERVAALMEQIK